MTVLSNIGSVSNHKDHQHHRKIPTKYEPTDFLQLYKEPFTIMIKNRRERKRDELRGNRNGTKSRRKPKTKYSDKEDAMYVKEEVGPCLELFPR